MSRPGAGSFRRERLHRRKDVREVKRSEVLDHQEKRNQESKIANPIDDECFLTGRRRRVFCEPEADQQVRRQAHALPADEHDQIVLRQHQRQHEEHEQVHVRHEAVVTVVFPHVADRVDVNEEADAGDYEQHDER